MDSSNPCPLRGKGRSVHLLVLVGYVTEKADFSLYAVYKDRSRSVEYPLLSGGAPGWCSGYLISLQRRGIQLKCERGECECEIDLKKKNP